MFCLFKGSLGGFAFLPPLKFSFPLGLIQRKIQCVNKRKLAKNAMGIFKGFSQIQQNVALQWSVNWSSCQAVRDMRNCVDAGLVTGVESPHFGAWFGWWWACCIQRFQPEVKLVCSPWKIRNVIQKAELREVFPPLTHTILHPTVHSGLCTTARLVS